MTEGPLRLLAVHAHPDDEASKGAATMARYVAEGVEVLVATCTGGERGSILNPAMDRPEVVANLSGYPPPRDAERDRDPRACTTPGSASSTPACPEGDPLPPLPEGCFALESLEDAAEPLVRLVRTFRPHVITTYDENGGYPHPDHIMTHKISVEAFEAAADPDRYPGTGEPWQPLKLYYHMTFHRNRFLALHEAMVEAGLESPYADRLEEWSERPDLGDAGDDPGPVRRLLRRPRPGADRARDAGRSRRRSGSPARSRSSRRRGRPRTTSSRGRWSTRRHRRTTCSPASRTRRGDDRWRWRRRGVRLADGDDALGAGFIAFMVVLALAIASYFLFRSMTRHLRKVPPIVRPAASGPRRELTA